MPHAPVPRSPGHEARRPLVENLGDGIYELRIRVGRQNYRILYFFFGRVAVVLTSGFTKAAMVPRGEIDTALRRKRNFEENPESHCVLVEADFVDEEEER